MKADPAERDSAKSESGIRSLRQADGCTIGFYDKEIHAFTPLPRVEARHCVASYGPKIDQLGLHVVRFRNLSQSVLCVAHQAAANGDVGSCVSR